MTENEGESVVLRYGQMVYNIALRYVTRPEDAEDVYSETFLNYFRRDWQFESEEHRKAWLIRVTINCANSLLRKRNDPLELNEEIAGEAPSWDRELYADLHDAVSHLAPIYKDVVVLFYLEDLPVKEVARLLDLNENTVKGRLRIARELLKKALGSA